VHRFGRKPAVSGKKETELCEHTKKHPDVTGLERGEALGLNCSEKAVWQTLRKLGWRFKTSRRAPASNRALVSP